ESPGNPERPGPGQLAQEGVDHQVADEVDPRRVDTFTVQVAPAAGLGDQQHVGQSVGDDPVDLFGHPAVTRPQPRLDVRDQDVELDGRQGAGHRRVHVAGDDHAGGTGGAEVVFVPLEDAGRLPGVGVGADAEPHVGGADAELLQEDVRHL